MTLKVPHYAKEKKMTQRLQPFNKFALTCFFFCLPEDQTSVSAGGENPACFSEAVNEDKLSLYLIPSTLVNRQVPFQQCAVREAAAALRAAEGLLGLLVAVPDVLLQRAVALVAARAVRAGEQLGEQIGWSS